MDLEDRRRKVRGKEAKSGHPQVSEWRTIDESIWTWGKSIRDQMAARFFFNLIYRCIRMKKKNGRVKRAGVMESTRVGGCFV